MGNEYGEGQCSVVQKIAICITVVYPSMGSVAEVRNISMPATLVVGGYAMQ